MWLSPDAVEVTCTQLLTVSGGDHQSRTHRGQRRTSLVAAACLAGTSVIVAFGTGCGSTAHARTARVRDAVTTNVTSPLGAPVVTENGPLTGTLDGHIELTTQVERQYATFKTVTPAGAFEGYAHTTYSQEGSYVRATLHATVTHGSGLYAGIHASKLLIAGGFTLGGSEARYTMTGVLSY